MIEDKAVAAAAVQAEQHLKNGDYQKALDLYDLLLQRDPDNIHFRYCVGSIYSELYKMGIAISMLKSVVKDAPDHSQSWNNLGIAYKNAGRLDDARQAYEKALELNYDPITLVNLSGLYINNGTPDEALKWAKKGLKLMPDNPQLNNHWSLALLEKGQWKEGFDRYDARFGLPGWSPRKYNGPMWRGERVDRLLIHGEQGLGDEIMFMGSLDRVLKRVNHGVTLECATRLVELFKYSFGVDCYGTEKEIHDLGVNYDAWIPMGSLFRIVGFEDKAPYLDTPKTYPGSSRFRIGLSWRGGTLQTHEHLRNFPIEQWQPLANLDADVISVQYGPAAGMAQRLGLPHDQAAIDDITSLAAMIKSCDLIVTVCNTTVHMAGALGVPCWVLTPKAPAWRYGFGDHMPFYKSVRLFQQRQDDWPTVINRVVRQLADDYGILPRSEQAAA